jgi:hypothetical protein
MSSVSLCLRVRTFPACEGLVKRIANKLFKLFSLITKGRFNNKVNSF